jgi:formylglycine-generating enzyme required for sulfatase activity
MKTTSTALCGFVTALLTSAALLPHAEAITIAHGGDSVDIDFVDIGNVGNTGDTANTVNGANPGAVNYEYSIGTYEVTSDQWAAVAGFDALVEDNSNDPWTGSQPTANASWYEAAKFANWLTSGDALQGAYGFSDATTFTGVDRDTALTTFGTIYVLPTEDEWYKAAYLKSDGSGYTTYATGNSTPDGIDSSGDTDYDSVFNDGFNNGAPLSVGGGTEENNGTYDMGGNVWEWSESAFDGTLDNPNESRVLRGGLWSGSSPTLQSSLRFDYDPGAEDDGFGFRVASVSAAVAVVPEPSSVGLLVIGAMGCMLRRKRS